MTKQEKTIKAKTFDRFSEQNYLAIKSQLKCNCEPYQDVYTFNRWNLQGYKIIKGSKGIKILTYVRIEIKNDNNEVINTYTKPKTTTVFCRCQVEEFKKDIAV